MAQDIYKTYITKGAKKEINVNDTLKSKIKGKRFCRFIKLRTADLKTGDVTIFDDVLRSIFGYIESQVYPSFLNSSEYKSVQNASTTNSRASLKSHDYSELGEVEPFAAKKKSTENLLELLSKISKILTEALEYAEIEEFLRTIQEIQNDLSYLIVCDFEDNKQLRISFVNSIRDYLALLEQLKQTGRLERFVTSDRLRRKMEEINYNIFNEYDTYKKSLFLITPTSSPTPEVNSRSKDYSPVTYKKFYDTPVPVR